MECTEYNLFSPTAMEHAQDPRNNTPLLDFNGHARITGPCGDTMEFWLLVQKEKIDKVSFITDGCGSSLACGSMTTCLAEGKNIEEANALKQQDILKALGNFPKESEHCALLAVNTLKAACQDYRQHKQAKENSCGSCNNKTCSASQRNPNETEAEFQERQKLQARLCKIHYKILVMSGKGGVGKSTVAVNLAVALMMSGFRVGLMDVDIHGPSIPTMLGMEGTTIQGSEGELLPPELGALKVMSLGFFLNHQDDAVIWRGPRKMGLIQQFLKDVAWGELDFLIVDSPPGTGDEPLSVCQLIGQIDGAIVVTTPQKVAAVDVRKSITFCKQLDVPVCGVVENMSGFACPKCGEISQIFSSGGGEQIARDMHVPFLGSIPIDPKIMQACDDGQAFIHHYATSFTAEIMRNIIKPILSLAERKGARVS